MRHPVPPRGTPPANQAAGCTEAYPWNGTEGDRMTEEKSMMALTSRSNGTGKLIELQDEQRTQLRALLAIRHSREPKLVKRCDGHQKRAGDEPCLGVMKAMATESTTTAR
ncbi:unnamed protein product, partial [Urochloa humidicola]